MKLISMTDFVIKAYNKKQSSSKAELEMYMYAIFLKQPLELWMFVPCDEDGNVLDYPDESMENSYYERDINEYQQAKERCLFDGFNFDRKDDDLWYFSTNEFFLIGIDKSKKIEYLIEYNLQITKTAEKLIGL